MYPSTYYERQYSNIRKLQNSPRKIRLLFAGSVDPLLYSKTEPQSILGKFKILPRTTVIETITSHLAKEIIPLENWHNMKLLLNSSYRQKCIILHKSNFKVPNEKWLEVVAKSDFFICAPAAP